MTGGKVLSYTYSGDKLVSLCHSGASAVESAFEYDVLGNPTTYKGNTLKWGRLRNLESFQKNIVKAHNPHMPIDEAEYTYPDEVIHDKPIEFEYNASNLRILKKQRSNHTKYIWSGDRLFAERRYLHQSDNVEDYLDEGSPSTLTGYSYAKDVLDIHFTYNHITGIDGFRVRNAGNPNWTMYYYRKNLQGDVTQVLSGSTVVAEYVYDAWGNHTIITNINGIADLNPIRYRGYYFDNETGLYYLKSRYYDPQVGRFLNMDNPAYLDSNCINGLNLFSYAANNPIMMIDSNGRRPIPNPSIYLSSNLMATSNDFQPNNFIDVVNHTLINTLSPVFSISAGIFGAVSGVFSTIGAEGLKLFGVSKIFGGFAAAIAIGASWYNNFYNPNLSLQEKFTYSIADTAFVGASIGLSYLASAGTAALLATIIGATGPVGWIAGVGLLVGVGVTMGLQLAWNTWGDDIKKWFNSWVGSWFN